MSFAGHIRNATSDVVPALQRQCDCGGAAKSTGGCADCERKARLGVGPSLGAPGDRFEQEADQIAHQVLSGGAVSSVQRMEDGSGEEEEEEVHAKSAAPGRPATATPAQAAASVATGGTPLPASERAYFEPRFGRDLSSVRVHTGSVAQSAARSINARAFTHRNNIAFAAGEYAPGTFSGRHLMAHEITHTLQQGRGRVIRRTCPKGAKKPNDLKPFEARVDQIKAHKDYGKLNAQNKKIANDIIDGARASECPMYYVEKLWTLFNTGESADADQAKEARKKVSKAETAEKTRLGTKAGGAGKDAEEILANDPARKFKDRSGEAGDKFRVDASDPTNIIVKLRVRASKAGKGTDEDVRKTKALEDAIEKHASTKGFTVDIEFTDAVDNYVFPVGVDPTKWTTSGNWVGDPREIAHEAMHLLKLEDRYNYIEAHAGNADMDVPERLYWFREQMVRGPDPTGAASIMDDYNSKMDEIDICAVAGGHFRTCLVTRFGMLKTTEIEAKAKPLNTDYRPEHAALLQVMRQAWNSRPFDEVTSNCTEHDPLCGLPPIEAFGDSNITAMDEARFPLRNPHQQPSGKDDLIKTKRSP